MKKYLWCFLLFVFSPATSFCQFEEADNRILTEFIVMLKPTHSIEQLLREIQSAKAKQCLSKRMNIYLLERSATSSAEDFLFVLRQNEHVKLAQFNHRKIEQRSLVPNDSFFNLQWNMLNTGQSGGIVGSDIKATEAWDINTDNITANGDTIVVAIVDGNFDRNHEDINYFINYNEIDSNGVDDDGNGYIDDRSGWSIANNSGNVQGTSDPHSTHLSGIVGAIGNNNKGVAGVCWGVKILPINRKSNIESDVVMAYEYVYTMRFLYNNTFGSKGAFIVATNSSFGVNNGKPVDYPIWCAMYDSLGSVGIMNVSATANLNINVDTQHDMPTECPSKWMISVTNTTRTDQRNTGAAYGQINIDLGAPGTGVYSTTPLNTYGYNTGTSMSAPHVAGTVAAMYAAACKGLIDAYHAYPDSISLLIKDYLIDGVEWNSSLNNITSTNGGLNVLRAILNLKKFNCDSCNFNISIDKVPISCKSINDGAMAVTVNNGSIFDYAIMWSNAVTAPECLSVPPGFYTVSVLDTVTGCRRYTTAELHNPDTILITAINIIPAEGGNPGNISITASAGNDVLLYSLDGNNYQQTAIFSVPSNGNYTVYIKNSTGCVVQQEVIVSSVNEFQITNYELRITPNPAKDELAVYSQQFATEKNPLEIFDVSGRKVYETIPLTINCQLSTVSLTSGIYFLRYRNTTRKFAVMH